MKDCDNNYGFTPHLFRRRFSSSAGLKAQSTNVSGFLNSMSLIRKGAGFTLIEMLVSLGIIVLLSGIVAVNFNSFRSAAALDSEIEELGSVLRRAQLWALTGQTRSGARPAGGWGVHLDECTAGSCTYWLFADLGIGDHIYNDPGDPNDEIALTFVVSDQISVASLIPGTPLDIVFSPPNAEGYINGAQLDAEATITLEQPLQSLASTIRIDRVSGRINIE